MNSQKPTLVWFRNNLRTYDNAVLKAAIERGSPIIPIYFLETKRDSRRSHRSEIFVHFPQGASRLWLYHSLNSFQQELSKLGSRLVLLEGDPFKVFERVIRETGSGALYWDRSYEPYGRKRDEVLGQHLKRRGVFCASFNDTLLFDPSKILTREGTPFKVFTAFWNHCSGLTESEQPIQMPRPLPVPSHWPKSKRLEDLGLRVQAAWSEKIESFWQPGCEGAQKSWHKFLKNKLKNYSYYRNEPSIQGTSRLSPYLHFGEISARSIWYEVNQSMSRYRKAGIFREAEAFLRQIVWREFAYYLLYHFPKTVDQSLKKEFKKFKWRKDVALFHAWQKGQTGYPIVDAGMRELWATGWMHNRVRMIVASFLVKDLLQSWQEGARWFWDTLVDADLANNTFGWQWTAGCGADAAPYFRIFNPVLQGEKFDSAGNYVRRWIPELSKVPKRFIHQPWNAPSEVLIKAGVRFGRDYPERIVDHDQARKRALFAYARIKK